jgi:hypothetical protein
MGAMMECANCGRHNQPTTRFCADCGDVLRTDPPRKHRSRSKKRVRRLRKRTHWVRVALRTAPSIMTTTRPPPPVAVAVAEHGASERMMRRIDLLFALLVCIVGFAAYLGFPQINGSRTESAQTAVETPREPPRVVQVPLAPLEPPPPRTLDGGTPAPLASALPPLPASRNLDVVPPRTAAERPRPDAAERRAMESAVATPPKPSYARTAAYGVEGFGPPPAAAPARPVSPPPRAAAAPTDPLQQMNDAIAGCAGAGFFARIACEQRALLTYCDGRWGQTERCPSGRTADYGN